MPTAHVKHGLLLACRLLMPFSDGVSDGCQFVASIDATTHTVCFLSCTGPSANTVHLMPPCAASCGLGVHSLTPSTSCRQRYKYMQPEFCAGMEKRFQVPGPNAYTVRKVRLRWPGGAACDAPAAVFPGPTRNTLSHVCLPVAWNALQDIGSGSGPRFGASGRSPVGIVYS
jgi:hypothetical protein